MGRIFLEGGIIVLLVLVGISMFVPGTGTDINGVISDFEEDVGSKEEVNDGVINDIVISEEYSSNLIARMNGKIANVIVKGLNGVFGLGMNILRKLIN